MGHDSGLFVRGEIDGKPYRRVFVHPLVPIKDVPSSYKVGPIYLATPTSSSRTLVIWDPADPSQARMIKVSLPQIFSGLSRTLKESEVREAVAITNFLDQRSKEIGKEHPYLRVRDIRSMDSAALLSECSPMRMQRTNLI